MLNFSLVNLNVLVEETFWFLFGNQHVFTFVFPKLQVFVGCFYVYNCIHLMCFTSCLSNSIEIIDLTQERDGDQPLKPKHKPWLLLYHLLPK